MWTHCGVHSFLEAGPMNVSAYWDHPFNSWRYIAGLFFFSVARVQVPGSGKFESG
jgi:hypothetical protein